MNMYNNYKCSGCGTVNCSTNCTSVNSCVNNELFKIISDSANQLQHFCAATVHCVDQQFFNVAAGLVNGFEYYQPSIIKILKELSGYNEDDNLHLISDGGDLQWTETLSGSGTVTSFSAGDLSPLFTTSEANPTTTPALSFALSNAAANTFFGNNTGSSTTPSYNTMAALTKVDDTNVTLTLGGTPATSLLKAVSLTLGWTGQLSLSRGGTGVSLADPGADRILFWDDSAGNVTWLQLGTNLSITGTTINASGGSGSAAVEDSFNSTSDWGSPSGGYYTYTFTHSLGTKAYGITIWDDTSTSTKVEVDLTTQPDNNSVSIRVTETPDGRFAGRIVLSP